MNVSQLCKCGCGAIPPIATYNYKSTGMQKGKPRDYCPGHRPIIRRSKIWTVSREELKKIVEDSDSNCDILRKLGYERMGRNLGTLKERLEFEEIIPPRYVSKPPITTKPALNDVLVENSSYSRKSLKKRLIEENILEHICDECDQGPEWNGKQLVLNLDHKNGIHNDNRIENLRFLCPNCHSQTDTFASRNKLKIQKKCSCGKNIYKKSKACVSCSNKSTSLKRNKIKWPSRDEVLKMIEETNYFQTGKALGVSDNAVRKYLKRTE